jgi:hypothetical protein
MPPFYEFAIVRIAPDDARDERINIGLAIFQNDRLDLRISAKPQKIRAISGALSAASVHQAAALLEAIDAATRASGLVEVDHRYEALSRVGVLSLSSRGQFVAQDAAVYDARVASLIRNYVDPEVAPKELKEKRSRLLTKVKKSLRQERILALKDEGLDSHRVVPQLVIADGLVADLALKNSVMHVVETVDASHEGDSLGKVIGEVAVSSLVLQRATMNFGPDTKPRLVYAASAGIETHVAPSLEVVVKQGVRLFNWNSDNQQAAFLQVFASLAIQNHDS